MSFLFVNRKPSSAFAKVISAYKTINEDIVGGQSVYYAYDSSIWGDVPVIEKNGKSLLLSGWFILDDKLNDINLLHDEIILNGLENAQSKIQAGIFTAIFFDSTATSDEFTIFQDPASLLPHYWTQEKSELVVTPECGEIISSEDTCLTEILVKKGHLFGDNTIDKQVKKILPFEHLVIKRQVVKKVDNSKTFHDYVFGGVRHEDFFDSFKKVNRPLKPDVCALSAGFDSRLIAHRFDPSAFYTWGPKHSQDVIVAEKISNNKEKPHFSFSFTDEFVNDIDDEVCCALFKGSVLNPNARFLCNYRKVKNEFKSSVFSLDGYLGDVLQRGTYNNFKGTLGEFLKIFPKFYDYLNISDRYVLRSRYRELGEKDFDMLWEDYKKKTDILCDEDPYTKVTFYEFFYGRGGRYISTGGIVMNSLFFNVVPAFCSKSSLNYFFNQKMTDALEFKTFKKVWSDIDDEAIVELNSEGGYSSKTPRVLIPLMNFLGRLNTRFNPRRKNYSRGGR
ncbi:MULTISPECIES: hypothetical protein [Halomonas]|uniref:hypothetical protein n=1 Tax=Halomonas TaxID=2745 RepID=UPI001C940962|nr:MULTISPECIES: hypothetical protein [Halomonas]MBY6208225.1 hypothetical protein [Halomonas sp. DP3Y7-2]MBY6229034.1 hypothetical protein [Halomonas sp. DP3Y7-1]MCA0916983.1 hypothetical protein [Halomonas denitrificans]